MKKFFVHDADLVQYAISVLRRNLCSVPEKALELIVSKDAMCSVDYAIRVVKGRWGPGEEAISKCGASSLDYARYVIKGRWEPGEDAISSSTEYMYLYANDVIDGRLPDSLHNKMVLAGSDEWTKKYFKAKKYRRLKKVS